MLIAIDASVEHGDALAAGAIAGAKLIMLDPQQDSIQQITQAIHHTAAKSVHIVTHGSPGCLHFSSGDVTSKNLHYYADQFESWFRYAPAFRGSTMRVQSHDHFLSLYACNVGAKETGRTFVEKLHHLVGVSIHASSRKIGTLAVEGSWQLDISYPFPHKAQFPFTDDLLKSYEVTL
ncbi:MAG: DUF4347 domain-containing protein [Cyanobacteria bacterium J06554_3]